MNYQKYLHQGFEALSHFIAPPFCVQCRKFLQENSVFCIECENLIKSIVSTQLEITKTKSISGFALSAYKDPIKPLILAKSWRNRLAAKQLGQLLWRKTYIKNVPFDLIVPVPLHWSRYAKRGYNQAEVMAQELSKLSGKPVVNAIKRIKPTPFLSSVSASKRPGMVKDVFEFTGKENLKDKHILLIDDLMTTGVTLRAVAKELYKEKTAAITAVVAARVC